MILHLPPTSLRHLLHLLLLIFPTPTLLFFLLFLHAGGVLTRRRHHRRLRHNLLHRLLRLGRAVHEIQNRANAVGGGLVAGVVRERSRQLHEDYRERGLGLVEGLDGGDVGGGVLVCHFLFGVGKAFGGEEGGCVVAIVDGCGLRRDCGWELEDGEGLGC